MEYDWEFGERIRCSADEKSQCLALVSQIVSMAQKAKRNGLLSLVQEAEETTSFLLRKGLQLILEGVQPSLVETTLEYYILSGTYTGKDLLERCIIKEGVLAIQKGVNPQIIQELLLSLFGEKGHEAYDEEFGDKKKDKQEVFFDKIKKDRAATPLSSKLGHTIIQLDDQSIQQCLKEISTVDLARALKGMEGEAKIKVFKNLPKRSAAILQETVEHLDLMRDSEMTEAQEKILLVISGLEAQSDIRAAN
ncbi:MAG: FliG C-terminal domain-containing protein [Desulfobacterales bacterium]